MLDETVTGRQFVAKMKNHWLTIRRVIPQGESYTLIGTDGQQYRIRREDYEYIKDAFGGKFPTSERDPEEDEPLWKKQITMIRKGKLPPMYECVGENQFRLIKENWVTELTLNDYKQLKRAYNAAVKGGLKEFEWRGHTWNIEYIKYVLQLLASKYEGIKEIGFPGQDETVVKRRCPMCGAEQEIRVKTDDIEKYKKGAMIQQAFPYLSPDQREALKTGICSNCWNKIFGG